MIIKELKPNEIFVFGSNKNGIHAGGAAKIAVEQFGAEWGNMRGFQGQCYAIPTLDKEMKKVPLKEIREDLNVLFKEAQDERGKIFYLTPIGTGIAGYTIDELESILPQLPANVIPTWK